MIQGLNQKILDQLLQWLVYELQTCRSERVDLEQDWIRFQKVYKARPKNPTNDFPFKGASNIVIQIAATDVDTTVAALIGALFAAPNLWSTEALRPDWIEFAARLEEFLEWAQEAELSMYGTTVDWVTEICKLGTGIMKQRYIREEHQVFEWREMAPGTMPSLAPGMVGNVGPQVIQQMIRRITANRPDVSWVPLPNFYIPASYTTVKAAPWCAERFELSWNALNDRIRMGIYRNDALTRIGAHWRSKQAKTPYSTYQTAIQELEHFIPGQQDSFELFEFWTTFDILGMGEPVPVVCTIHEPSMTYLRVDFNPYFHQEKPYSKACFVRQEGRFYGIGLCEMQEMVQDEVTALRRQRIDNGTIQNTTVFAARRGSGIKQDEPIWPGRIFLVDNPSQDLIAIQMGRPLSSTLNEEQWALQLSQRRSGISDWQRGGAGTPAISYSTATTTIEMLRQGKMRLDQVLREIQSAEAETGQRVVELYQQYDQAGKVYSVMGPKDGQIMQEVLTFPLDTIRTGMAIKVTATNAQLNRETKIRTDQIVLGMVMQFYQQMFQAMSIVVNPQLPVPLRVLAGQMIQGGTILTRQILDTFGQQNLDQIIPDLETLNGLTQQLGNLGQEAGTGGPPVGPGPTQPQGFPALLPGAGGASGPFYGPAPSGAGYGGNAAFAG